MLIFMKKLTLILLLLLAFILVHAETIRGRVLWIHDGDTVTITTPDNRSCKIRLWGIDAPENGQEYGREATLELIRLTGRKFVTVEVKGTDKYKRTLGIIRRGKLNVNLAMVKAGAAWHYVHFAPKAADLAEAEAEARKNKAGLWKKTAPLPPWEYRQKKAKPADHGAKSGNSSL